LVDLKKLIGVDSWGFTMGNREHYSENRNEILGSVTCRYGLP
jgi:hypothetical protein